MTLRARVAAGDRDALGEAFMAYRPLALAICRERGRAEADLEDLAQEAFLLLPECARRCAPATSIVGCVATAVRQAIRAFDCHSATGERKIWRRRTGGEPEARRVELEPGDLHQIPDSAWTPEEVLQLREKIDYLSRLLLRVPSREREILIAREAGMSAGEVAERFGIKLGTVAAHSYRARSRLKWMARRAAA